MKHYYKRKLPHFVVDGYAYFVTTRLANSLPQNVILSLKNKFNIEKSKLDGYKNNNAKREANKDLQWQYFMDFDSCLHKYFTKNDWLKIDAVAKIVNDALFFRDQKYYDLIAFTIMSNHIHIVFKPYFDLIKNLPSLMKYILSVVCSVL